MENFSSIIDTHNADYDLPGCDIPCRQLRFDDNLNIIQEISLRELSPEERAEYDRITEDATQLCLDDFI